MKSKFSNINYPIFGLQTNPTLKYESTKLFGCKSTVWYLINDTSINCSYLEKLLVMKNRMKFDYTCRNINELINSKTVWAIDNNCIIYDLHKKQKFKRSSKKIMDKKGNYMILDRISYPIKIPNYFTEVELIGMYAQVVYIDNCWYVYSISHFRQEDEQITL